MKTLISILGPTAAGKTSFALKLAEQALELKNPTTNIAVFSGVDLISADSRQIYKGLEILSGADVPESFKQVFPNNKNRQWKLLEFPFFEKIGIGTNNAKSTVCFHGVSILDLTDEWSLAHFKNFAINITKNSFANNRLPIIVGGTNLYIKHLFNLDDNLYISPISEVRDKAKNMQVKELQHWLKSISPEKLSKMNNSDVNNPRRLVRAIEISVGKSEVDKVLNLPDGIRNFKIGLISDLDSILTKINKRVIDRFENGAINEVEKLNKICEKNNLGVCSTLGVSDINSYLGKEIDQKECLENWVLHEFQYAKRQLVWLKKERDVIWLDDLAKSSYTLGSKLFDK